MKISKPSLAKIQWLVRNPAFKKKPLRTITKMLGWEVFRVWGRPITYTYDRTLLVRLYPNDGVARLVYYFNYHEPLEFDFLDRYLEAEMICMDIGANIGMYALFMAKRIKQVIAFEPQAEAVMRLKESIATNNLSNITIVQKAVSDKTGKLALSFVEGDSAKTFTTEHCRETHLLVDAISLDEYLDDNSVQRLDYLKIDAEGAEQSILLGAQRTLRELRPLIQIEIAPEFQIRSGYPDFDFKEFFINLKYTLYFIDPQSINLRQGDSWNTIAVPNEKMKGLQLAGLLTA